MATAYEKLLKVLDKKIKECEEKAATAHKRHKYIMYGYWKAIAVHFRKVRRDFRKEVIEPCPKTGENTRRKNQR